MEDNMKKYLLMTLLGTSVLFSSNVMTSDLEISSGNFDDVELTEKSLKPIKWKLHSDISEEQWECLPTKASVLDISDINSISKVGLEKISRMTINTLNLSNLQLVDKDLEFLPHRLEKLFLNNTLIGGYGLKYLPETVKEIDISNTTVSIEALKECLPNKNIKIIKNGELLVL